MLIADTQTVVSWRARPRSFVALMGLYESNYIRLGWLAGDLRALAGRYASRAQVQYELRAADALFGRLGIPSLDTSESSIEEIASRILNSTAIERRLRP